MDFPRVFLKYFEFPIFRFDPSVDGDPTVEGGQKFRHRTILCMPIMYSNKPNKVLGVFQLGVVHQILSQISNCESMIFLTNIYYDFFFNWQRGFSFGRLDYIGA